MRVSPPVALGLRLAWSATGRGRWRSIMLAVAAFVGTVLLLPALAVAQAVRSTTSTVPTASGPNAIALGALVLAILLPVAVLSATAGRLSSALRERRLANLRLLGMTPAEVRTTAATEAGVVALAGWVCGVAASYAAMPLLARVEVAGARFAPAELQPRAGDHVLVALAVPGLVLALSLARRRTASQALTTARRAGSAPPSWWWLLPLAAGVVLCMFARTSGPVDVRGFAMLAGIGLVAVGMLLLLPVFVRLVADLLLRARRPTATVAARRMQAQPAAMTRVLSALVLGLFLVTGARAVGVAFESTPQYAVPHSHVTVEASAVVDPGIDPDATARDLRSLDGVRRVVPVTHVGLDCTMQDGMAMCQDNAIVAACDDLRALAPEVRACPEQPVRLVPPGAAAPSDVVAPGSVEVFADVAETVPPALTAVARPQTALEVSERSFHRLNASVLIPTTAAGAQPLAAVPTTQLVVLADPSPDLDARVLAAGHHITSAWDMAEYHSVRGVLELLRLLSVVVLGIGILSFGIAAVDRAFERREEVLGLQLLGVPASLLRRSQWLETGLPLAAGSLLALGLGRFAGSTYLGLADYDQGSVPPEFFWPLVVGAVAGSVLVAALSSLAAAPRIRPELFRTE